MHGIDSPVSDVGFLLRKFMSPIDISESLCFGLGNGLHFDSRRSIDPGLNEGFFDSFCENFSMLVDRRIFTLQTPALIDRISFFCSHNGAVPIVHFGTEIKHGLLTAINNDKAIATYSLFEDGINLPLNTIGIKKGETFLSTAYTVLYLTYKKMSSYPLERVIRISISRNIDEFVNPKISRIGLPALIACAEEGSWRKQPGDDFRRRAFGKYLIEASDILHKNELQRIGENYCELAEMWSASDKIIDSAINEEQALAAKLLSMVLI